MRRHLVWRRGVTAAATYGSVGLGLLGTLIAALRPERAPERVAGPAFVLRSRYDIRSGFLLVSMLFRLAGFAIGSRYGVAETVLGVLAAQIVASSLVGGAALRLFQRFPKAQPV